MVKIIIFEDEMEDLFYKYGNLREKGHDLHVRTFGYLSRDIGNEDFMFFNVQRDHSGKPINEGINKFDTKNIRPYAPDEKLDADLYFADGLNGKWEVVLSDVANEKGIVNSGEPLITDRAKGLEYHVLQGEQAHNLVEKLTNNSR